MIKRIIKFLVFILLLISLNNFIISSSSDNNFLKTPIVKPGSRLFLYKRLWEKLEEETLFLKSAKLFYYHNQTNERFRELKYVVENKRLNDIERASYRFSYEAGKLSEFILSNNLSFEQNTQNFSQYIPLLENFRDDFPAQSSNWLLIQQDIDTLNILQKNRQHSNVKVENDNLIKQLLHYFSFPKTFSLSNFINSKISKYFPYNFHFLFVFIFILPVSYVGIVLVKRVVSVRRAEVVIPLGILCGIITYIFILNIFSFFLRGVLGILIITFLFFIISSFILRNTKTVVLDYPEGKAKKLWIMALILWGIFLYFPIAHMYAGAEQFMYDSIAKTFSRGNFPILSPWQPDLYVSYHYGYSILEGAINILTGAYYDQIQRIVGIVVILSTIQLLVFGLKRHNDTKVFIFYQIIVLLGLVSFGSIMIIWPVWPIKLPEIKSAGEFFAYIISLPNMTQTMDSYGMPSRLAMIVYQIHHALGLANFFLLIILATFGKIKRKLFWLLFFVNLTILAVINESLFPAAFLSTFFVFILRDQKKGKLLSKRNLSLVLFYFTAGLFSLFEGGMITDNLFRNKNIESGIKFVTFKDIPERLHYFLGRVFQILPMKDEWVPFRWSHLDFILMFLMSIALLIFIKSRIKKHVLIIVALIIAALVTTVTFYTITVKFLPADANRFLSFTYIFLGITLGIETSMILEQFYLKKKRYLILIIILVLWILIPSSITFIFGFWNITDKNDYFLLPEDHSIPPVNVWLSNNINYSERTLDLVSFTYYKSEKAGYHDRIIKSIPPISGVFSPYWDGKYQAFMYTPGPDYLSMIYFLNPSSVVRLKLKYLIIDRQFFKSLPIIRQRQLQDPKYFSRVFVDDKTIPEYWVAVYEIKDAYYSLPDIEDDVFALEKLIPEGAKVYLENNRNSPTFDYLQIKNAELLVLNNKDLAIVPDYQTGYGFLGVVLKNRIPIDGERYDYLVLKDGTDPKELCNCDAEIIWEGYDKKSIAWKVIENAN